MLSNLVMQVRRYNQTPVYTPPQRATISLTKDLQKHNNTNSQAPKNYTPTAHGTISQTSEVTRDDDKNNPICKENDFRLSKSNTKPRKAIFIEPPPLRNKRNKNTIEPICTSFIGNGSNSDDKTKAAKLSSDSRTSKKRKTKVTQSERGYKEPKVDNVAQVNKISDEFVISRPVAGIASTSVLPNSNSSSSSQENKRTAEKWHSRQDDLIKKRFKIQSKTVSNPTRSFSPNNMVNIKGNLAKCKADIPNSETATSLLENCSEITISSHVSKSLSQYSSMEHAKHNNLPTISTPIPSDKHHASADIQPLYKIKDIWEKRHPKPVKELRTPENHRSYYSKSPSFSRRSEHQSTSRISAESFDSYQTLVTLIGDKNDTSHPDRRYDTESTEIYRPSKLARQDLIDSAEKYQEKHPLPTLTRLFHIRDTQLSKELDEEIADMARGCFD